MSTRKRSAFRAATDTSTPPPPNADLPPPRPRKATNAAPPAPYMPTPPFSRVRFSTFVYVLSALAFAFIAFNAWRMVQLKTAAGGWWNLALGRRPGLHDRGGGGGGARGHDSAQGGSDSVEGRINALADALGVPAPALASAIADVAKSHVPPASLSAISAAAAAEGTQESATEMGMGMGMGETLTAAFAEFGDDVDMD